MRRLGEAARGFTLIEILVVIIVLGLLAALVGPRILGRVSEAKSATARTQIELLGLALDNYRLDSGAYPTTEQGLDAPLARRLDREMENLAAARRGFASARDEIAEGRSAAVRREQRGRDQRRSEPHQDQHHQHFNQREPGTRWSRTCHPPKLACHQGHVKRCGAAWLRPPRW